MNSGKEIRRSGRLSSRTEFFVAHYDRSYNLTPETNKTSKKQERNDVVLGISNELPNMSINFKMDAETDEAIESTKNLVNSDLVDSRDKIGLGFEVDRLEENEIENFSLLANSFNTAKNYLEESSTKKEDSMTNLKSSPEKEVPSITSVVDKTTKTKKRKTKIQKIEDQLRAIGDDPDGNSDGNCARAAIYNGFIKLTGQPSDLDQVILSGTLDCGHDCKAKLRDLLQQPDYAGPDFLDLEYATVFCDGSGAEGEDQECFPGATYVTGICSGNPTFDSGKFHNHCNRCKVFGKCIGDYRKAHCTRCGKHYFAGSGGQFRCKCCDGSSSSEGYDDHVTNIYLD